MFLFGHVGITLFFFVIVINIFPDFKNRINYFLVIIGSLLPDIIDKPIGRILLADSLNNGRIFAHTLIFCILLFIVAYYIWKNVHDSRILILAAANFFHLVEDKMWELPSTLFWPFLGWNFPTNVGNYVNIFAYINQIITTSYTPSIEYEFISEIIGVIICIILSLLYINNRKGNIEGIIYRND